jgi:uncharacterized membrane protein YbhN (UPF0104 family)
MSEPLHEPVRESLPNAASDATAAPAARARKRRPWATALTMGIVALVLGLLVWRERAALLTIDLRLAWPAILIGFLVMVAGLVVAAAIWAGIMRSLGSRVPTLRHMNIYATTYLSRHLPGTIWYVLGRGVIYRDEGDSARLVTAASAVELILSVMAGAIVSLTLLFSVGARAAPAQLPVALIAVGVALAVGAVMLHPATLGWALRRAGLHEAPRLPLRSLASWLALDALVWVAGGLILYLNARALLGLAGADLSFAYILFAWSLVGTLSVFIFFLPSNFGLSEIGLSLLLSAVMPSSVAVLVAILTRVLLIGYSAVGCLAIAAVTNRMMKSTPTTAAPPAAK